MAVLVLAPGGAEFHHGDCVGADAEAFEIVSERDPPWTTHAHPGDSRGEWHAHTASDIVHPQLTNRRRNDAIVRACDVLVACPSDTEARQRQSGTWATVRLARKAGKAIVVIGPDGAVTREG